MSLRALGEPPKPVQWPRGPPGVTGSGGRVCWRGVGQTLGISSGAPVGSLRSPARRKWEPRGVPPSSHWHVETERGFPVVESGFRGFLALLGVVSNAEFTRSRCAPAPALSALPLRLWGQAR